MAPFGNVPVDALVGTVEKLVAKMDEAQLAAIFERDLVSMPEAASAAFVEAAFDAFRDRGESSEDVVEGAGTTLAALTARERGAASALVRYAQSNPGVLKEAVVLFVEEHPALAGDLPPTLRNAIAERLAQPR